MCVSVVYATVNVCKCLGEMLVCLFAGMEYCICLWERVDCICI